jgi:hypothetical protein
MMLCAAHSSAGTRTVRSPITASRRTTSPVRTFGQAHRPPASGET